MKIIGLRHILNWPKWRLEPKFHDAGTFCGFGKREDTHIHIVRHTTRVAKKCTQDIKKYSPDHNLRNKNTPNCLPSFTRFSSFLPKCSPFHQYLLIFFPIFLFIFLIFCRFLFFLLYFLFFSSRHFSSQFSSISPKIFPHFKIFLCIQHSCFISILAVSLRHTCGWKKG